MLTPTPPAQLMTRAPSLSAGLMAVRWLCVHHPHLMVDHEARVKELIECLPHLPPAHAVALLHAVRPLFGALRATADACVLILRKVRTSRRAQEDGCNVTDMRPWLAPSACLRGTS